MNKQEMDDHVVFRKDFTIITTAIAQASKVALEAIFMRQTGLIFYGLSRVGKTCCIRMIKSKLVSFMPRAYVTQIEVAKKYGSYTNNILDQLAKEESLEFRARTLTVAKEDSVADMIILRCAEKNCNHWVLLLDEFQQLRNYDINVLFDVFNRLDRKGVTMTILSFAMPSVFEQRETLMKAGGNEQLIARFMSDLIEFRGCTSSEQLAQILHAYDSGSEYPPCSGITFTQGFAPQAFRRGFRLERCSAILWKAMSAASVGAYKNNLPMEHVFTSLRYLLRFIGSHDCPELFLPGDLISEVVEKCKIYQFTLVNGGRAA